MPRIFENRNAFVNCLQYEVLRSFRTDNLFQIHFASIIAATMVACKELGAKKGELLRYATSGDITGDKSSVVGYSSIIFT